MKAEVRRPELSGTQHKAVSAGPPDQMLPIGRNLRTSLTSAGIKLVDIGARGGTLPPVLRLASFSHLFAVEPDLEEARTLPAKLRSQAPWKEITVIPEAIAPTLGKRELYITRQPGLSSLLKPNYDLVRKYFPSRDWEIASVASVPTIPLDLAAEKYGFSDACFIKVDTQGTEFDILRSGERLLREDVLGVYIEIEFQPFYENQPLFADVDSYLRGFGFTLFDLHPVFVHRSAFDKRQYSKKQVIWAHALYLKDPEAWFLPENDSAPAKVRRFLGLALAFEHYDLVKELVSSGPVADLLCELHGAVVINEIETLIERRTRFVLSERFGIIRLLKGTVHDFVAARRGLFPS